MTTLAGAESRPAPVSKPRRRSRSLAAFATFGVAVVTPCCSLLTSTSGLSGGAATQSDGGADSFAGGEASPDASPLDGPSMDAEAGPPGCAAGELFCADFDEGTVDNGWSALSAGVGTMTVDTAAFVSPGRSVLVTLPRTVGYTQAITLSKAVLGGFQSFRCSFSIRRDEIGTSAVSFASLEVATEDGDIVTLHANAGATQGSVAVRYYSADAGTTTPQETPASVAFAPGAWHEMSFEIDRTVARSTIDGVMSASFEHGNPQTPVRAIFKIGGLEIDNTNDVPWKFRFDNVRCSRTP